MRKIFPFWAVSLLSLLINDGIKKKKTMVKDDGNEIYSSHFLFQHWTLNMDHWTLDTDHLSLRTENFTLKTENITPTTERLTQKY